MKSVEINKSKYSTGTDISTINKKCIQSCQHVLRTPAASRLIRSITNSFGWLQAWFPGDYNLIRCAGTRIVQRCGAIILSVNCILLIYILGIIKILFLLISAPSVDEKSFFRINNWTHSTGHKLMDPGEGQGGSKPQPLGMVSSHNPPMLSLIYHYA